MQFIYFVPKFKKPQITIAELDAIGLHHMHDGAQPAASPRDQSDFGPGLLVVAADPVCPANMMPDLVLKPDSQTWQPGPLGKGDAPAYYVGFWNDRRPTEASLRRTKAIGGASAKLADGSDWTLPLAYAQSRQTTLPRRLVHDGRKWVGKTAPAYEALSASAVRAAERLLKAYIGEAVDGLSYDSAMEVVLLALSLNYRIGATELSMLGLIDDESLLAVTEAVCDWTNFVEAFSAKLQGKSVADSQLGDGGSVESSADIARPVATSL